MRLAHSEDVTLAAVVHHSHCRLVFSKLQSTPNPRLAGASARRDTTVTGRYSALSRLYQHFHLFALLWCDLDRSAQPLQPWAKVTFTEAIYSTAAFVNEMRLTPSDRNVLHVCSLSHACHHTILCRLFYPSTQFDWHAPTSALREAHNPCSSLPQTKVPWIHCPVITTAEREPASTV